MPCGTLLTVRDNIIHSGDIMISKCVHPRGYLYSYRTPEDIIKYHINKNLYKDMEREMFNEKYIHDEKIGGDSMQCQGKK